MVHTDSRFRMVMRKYRELAGITLTELSRRSGIALPNLSQMENGKFEPSWQAVRIIRQVLSIPHEECFGPPVPGVMSVAVWKEEDVKPARRSRKKKTVTD